MKNAIFIILITFLGFKTYSQELPDNSKVTWGTTKKNSLKKNTLQKVILKNGNGYLISQNYYSSQIVGSPAFPTLQSYDENFNLVKSKHLKKLDLPKFSMFEELLPIQDKLYLFYSRNEDRDAAKNIYILELNKKTLEPIGEPKCIAKGNSANKAPTINPRKNFNNRVNIHFSPDSTKLLAVELIYNKSKNQSEFIIKTFDQELNLQWSKSYIDTDFEDGFSSMKPIIDNQGKVHFIVETIERKKTAIIFGTKLYKYTLISIDGTNREAIKTIISIPENYLNELALKLTNNGDLFIAGFYSDNKGFYNSIGSYSRLLSSLDHSNIFESIDQFEADFLPEKEVEKAKKRNKRKPRDTNYSVRDIFLKSNGSIVVIGENRNRTISSFSPPPIYGGPSSTPGMTSTPNYNSYSNSPVERFYYKNIVLIEFSPTGTKNWISKVKKNQYSIEDGGLFSSFHATLIDDDIYLMFNDREENIRVKELVIPKTFNPRTRKKDFVLSLVKVNNNGDQDRYELSNFKKTKLISRAKAFSKTGDHEILLFEEYKKKYRLGKLSLEKSFSSNQ